MARVTDTLEREKQELEDAARDAADAARSTASDVKDSAAEALNDAGEKAAAKLDEAKDRTRNAFRSGARHLHDLAEGRHASLEDAAERARVGYEELVERLDRAYHDGFSEGRRALQRSADQASDFARQHPLGTIAIGLAAGVVLGALLPRSGRQSHRDLDNGNFDDVRSARVRGRRSDV